MTLEQAWPPECQGEVGDGRLRALGGWGMGMVWDDTRWFCVLCFESKGICVGSLGKRGGGRLRDGLADGSWDRRILALCKTEVVVVQLLRRSRGSEITIEGI